MVTIKISRVYVMFDRGHYLDLAAALRGRRRRRIPSMRRYFTPITVASALIAGSVSAAPVAYTLNKDHTDVVFEISHFGFSNKHGWFRDMSGTLNLDAENPEGSSVSVTIKTASIDTNHAKRDQDLSGPPFLDVAKFADMTFVSTRVVRTGADTADITGALTLHGVTRPLLLHAKLNKIAPNPFDHTPTAGFRATGALKRSDYGVSAFLPMIGDDVAITIDAEFSGAKP
jgi:polyisoprenoid-binding protein YceI